MKIITFNIDNTTYGIKMDNLKEVIPYPNKIARLPKQSQYIVGVTSVRGKISLIVSLTQLLSIKETEYKYLIVLEHNDKLVSIPIDAVPLTQEVVLDNITTEFLGKNSFLEGVVKTENNLIVLIKETSLFDNVKQYSI